MIELCTRVTNITNADLLLFQFTLYEASHTAVIQMLKGENYEALLSERPGLQNIIYTVTYDNFNNKKSISQMCKRALQNKNMNVNIIHDFLLEMTSITPLFPSQKPKFIMLDNCTKNQFSSIKKNYDSYELNFQIFPRLPNLQMQN